MSVTVMKYLTGTIDYNPLNEWFEIDGCSDSNMVIEGNLCLICGNFSAFKDGREF